ncbi:MAG TPA: HDOD domain-containing protein [Gammaproteobacteria bacterium]
MRDKATILLEDIEANKLPSLPHVLVKLLHACRDEDICFDTLSDIISQDAALCSKVIKAANSPVYGRSRNLESLKHILMFLGQDTINSIAITASIKQFFSEYSNQKTSFLKSFWHHSLTCATIARSLAELTAYPYAEEAYIAGLLHDIGKLMIEPKMDAAYKTLPHGIYPATEVLQNEEDTLGINHPELASIMLEKWHLPDVICDAIRYHHADIEDIQQSHQLAKIIHLSSLLASHFSDNDQAIKTDAAIRLFDISESIINELVETATQSSHKLAASMDIDIGDTETSRNKDEAKQIQLAEEVRDHALVQNSQRHITVDSAEIYKALQQSVSLLFGISNSLLLEVDETRQNLRISQNQYISDSRLLDNLSIPLNSDSMIGNSLRQVQINDSFSTQQSAKLSILDQQVAHGLKADGFICVPVTQTAAPYGVLLLGCNQPQSASLLKAKKLIQLFASDVAGKLQQHHDYGKKLQDINEHNSDQFLLRAQKIVHETNNPLTVIRNYLQLLSKKITDNDEISSDLNIIRQEIDRISNIIVRCKDSMDSDISEISSVNINSIVSDLTDLFKSSLFSTHNIKSTLKLDNGLKNIASDRNYIKQILTNLIKNAVEAIEQNGEISISTGSININGRDYIELKLHDTGPGIPDEIMKNLYKPVISTKGSQHSGLGLSISKSLVDKIKGSISCTTSGSGTTFSVQIPVKT